MKAVIKRLLNEALFDKSKHQVDILNSFVEYACQYLKVSKPMIKLQFNREGLTTTASYGGNIINVYVKDRAIIDLCRSISHELVHHKQNIEGRLTDNIKDGQDGSPIENEANAMAGVLIRGFGKLHPEIYI